MRERNTYFRRPALLTHILKFERQIFLKGQNQGSQLAGTLPAKNNTCKQARKQWGNREIAPTRNSQKHVLLLGTTSSGKYQLVASLPASMVMSQ